MFGIMFVGNSHIKLHILIKNMKLIISFFVSFCFTALYAQKSYEFKEALPISGSLIVAVDARYFGTYEGETTQLMYIVSDSGIVINTINIQAISKETVRETGQYFVRNEHIFGVTKDSIPCVLQDDNYYFGVRNSVQLIGKGSENILMNDSPGTYFLNFKTEHGYTPALLRFENQQLKISYFDYDEESKIFKKIKEKQVLSNQDNSLTTIVLEPTIKEWQKLAKKELFGVPTVFKLGLKE